MEIEFIAESIVIESIMAPHSGRNLYLSNQLWPRIADGIYSYRIDRAERHDSKSRLGYFFPFSLPS